VIQAENLTKRYGAASVALDGVNLAVPPSSIFALVGPNGAGKSTLFKILLNLIRPSDGRATVMGTDSRRIGPAELASIGYVSESQQLPQWMRVGQYLRHLEAVYSAWDPVLAEELIREYELPLDRPLRSLSRGMRMKAVLAGTLAYRPKLILLDEPFSGLDILVREQLLESIIDRTPEATVLLASHDLSEFESVATHVAYLNQGRLQFVEEMPDLLSRFREIEVTLERPLAEASSGVECPSSWLHLQAVGSAVRFIETNYDSGRCNAEVASRFAPVRRMEAHPMSFRSIFLALARSRKAAAQ
jgi:ABC-2 type transport system ATP-binding protein